jgi:diaminopimelate decarboxylase
MNQENWNQIIIRATNQFETPFFLYSYRPIIKQLELLTTCCGSSVYNWLSFKTLPIKHLLRWWLSTGLGVEVVSEFELLAAQKEGFPPERIMVNGVAKHSWGKRCWLDGLRVNFDSITEIEILAPTAKKMGWNVGLRLHPSVERDPENPDFPDQFGIPTNNFAFAYDLLEEKGIRPDTVQIHLRSNIPNADFLMGALHEVDSCIKTRNMELKCLDLGGGLPEEGVEQVYEAWRSTFSIDDLKKIIVICREMFPSVREFILENGRYLLSDCGVIVLTVKDVKTISGMRFLICDGGRTNHALPSDWQIHQISTLPERFGEHIYSAVCGPTCMAFDCITRRNLPNDIGLGDRIIWFNAGAYHLSWETRFSQPLARVLWHDEEDRIVEARSPESFEGWWGRWK